MNPEKQPAHHRRHRHRRYRVPPEALGLGYGLTPALFAQHPALATPPMEHEQAAGALEGPQQEDVHAASLRVVWICCGVLLLILFREPILDLFRYIDAIACADWGLK